MTRRVWVAELRRHVGWFLLAVWIVVCSLLLFAHQEWAGELLSLAVEQRVDVIVLGPIAITLAVWAGGRDRRRGLVELLATMPAPSWWRHAVRWSALAAMLCAGIMVSTALGAFFVLGHTTYLGGRWWAVLLIVGAGLGALVALGLAIGALVPWRVAAPVAGLATYVGLGVPGYFPDSGFQSLLPNGYESLFVGQQPGLAPGAVTLVFFGLVTVAFIALMSRGGYRVALPVALAALGVGLVAGFQPPTWWWRPDPVGARSVCTADLPRVCVMRTHADLLPAVTRAVRPVLSGMGDVAPSEGAQEIPITQARFDVERIIPLTLYGQVALTGDHLLRPAQLRQEAASSPAIRCEPPDNEADRDYTSITALELGWTAVVLQASPDLARLDAGVWRNLRTAAPADQQEFLREYAAAGRSCDWSAIRALYEQWAG